MAALRLLQEAPIFRHPNRKIDCVGGAKIFSPETMTAIDHARDGRKGVVTAMTMLDILYPRP